VRDFKGLSNNSFDGHGNYTIGIKEQIIFTEINYDDIKKVRGFDVTLVTSTNKDEQAKALLKAIGLPFARQR
jgi:large subunit ribosomal protein L5